MELFIDIKEELEMVESELGVAVQAENQLLLETYKYLLNAGGKRLRPALCFYGAKFCDFDLQRLLPLAVALELIHMATLVHDDVVDASILRRGKPTINAIWGDSVSTHLGSYLFAEALLLLTRNDYPQIVYDKLSRVGVKMCEGELQQISAAFDVTLNTRRYLQRINRFSHRPGNGCLFSLCRHRFGRGKPAPDCDPQCHSACFSRSYARAGLVCR